MRIRRAEPSDKEALYAITRDSFQALSPTHYSEEQAARWMDGCTAESFLEGINAGRVHVAALDGDVVGYVEAVAGEITRLFVLPEAAGRGVGKRLLELGIRTARMNNEGPVVVESLRNAVPFYEKRGFVATGAGVSSHGTSETPAVDIIRMALPPECAN